MPPHIVEVVHTCWMLWFGKKGNHRDGQPLFFILPKKFSLKIIKICTCTKLFEVVHFLKKMLLSFALGHFPPNLWPLSMMYLLCTWNQENVATNQWKILQLTSALNLANQPPICGRHFCSHWKRLHSAWKWTDLLFRFEDHNYLNLFKLLWIVFQS